MVRDDAASPPVWLAHGTGALAGLRDMAAAIDSSTLSDAGSRELAAHCRSTGRASLEAPVAMSRPQAEAAQLMYGAPFTTRDRPAVPHP
jgi:3-hydroxyisobutyrate dehydrogenase-like beta-hydroxyacid dehydrogenase